MWFVNLLKVLLWFVFGMAALYAATTVLLIWSFNHGTF